MSWSTVAEIAQMAAIEWKRVRKCHDLYRWLEGSSLALQLDRLVNEVDATVSPDEIVSCSCGGTWKRGEIPQHRMSEVHEEKPPMNSETVSESVHGRANALLRALEEILGAPFGGEVRTTKALRCITVALNTEAVRVCERVARERVPFTHDDLSFEARLEGHRKQMEHLVEHTTMPSTMYLAGAVQFLLALAHQPGPGVVEIGGSSPAHEYELEELEEVEAARKRLRNAIDHGNRTNLLTKDVQTIIVAYETANQMNDEDREQIIRLETALAEARGNK